jgi:hypothetical protein
MLCIMNIHLEILEQKPGQFRPPEVSPTIAVIMSTRKSRKRNAKCFEQK